MEGEVAIYQRRRAYKTQWQRDHRRAFVEKNGFSTKAHYETGGQRERILKRDGYSCVMCGMTDHEHKAKWGKPITIDHKDKNRKHNTDDNLQTLCLSCHGSKDITEGARVKKAEPNKDMILQMRREGRTYRQIANEFSISIATAYKWIKKWEAING